MMNTFVKNSVSREREDKPEAGNKKCFQKTYLIRDYIQNIHWTLKTQQWEIKQLDLKTDQRPKWYLSKEDIHLANKHMERCSSSYVLWEMHI